eukprot:15436066-Alexandrium_andersonii.AAC.1
MRSAGPAPNDGPVDLPAGTTAMADDIDADWVDVQDDNDLDSAWARGIAVDPSALDTEMHDAVVEWAN